MSVLTIIAGPNGAGKSTHSKELLSVTGIEAFDFDKEFYSIWSRFDFDPLVQQGAFDRAQEIYIERRSEALEYKEDFAFETNYHTDDVQRIVDLFRADGYRIELVFICLETPELAIERVKQRVLSGGHFVDEGTIRSRFVSGLRRLDETFQYYDSVAVYTSEQNEVHLAYVLEPAKEWGMEFFGIPAPLRSFLKKFLAFKHS